ncbi:glutamate-cysteine ligase family protein [Thiohalorhabdus methylotrophus]|uniref:Glutamate-cysteine ligase family protein n=1 Tax=Thiohalorhabdus methylotrophus TaxID=3242694 RepID=A0ABV4TYK5_9GAMM
MGEKVHGSHYRHCHFSRFQRHLREETAALARLFEEEGFSLRHGTAGFELEAWLVDAEGIPVPANEAFLAGMEGALVSPELSRFNFELNTIPHPLEAGALERFAEDLAGGWNRSRGVARTLGLDPVMIGILPTVTEDMLAPANMSRQDRFHALNEQLIRLRRGRPIQLDIRGAERLCTSHLDVMTEAATTSLQIHLQLDPRRAVRYYNAAQILAAPLVAVSANSPFLFGHRLWQETRIPLYEQTVAGGILGPPEEPRLQRVTFGDGYLRGSLMALFRENLERYPVLLPVTAESESASFFHLRLHNGTIWRWNRPLVGFDPDGTPHLRIEHRPVPAGPTVPDMVANAALFQGLMRQLAESEEPPEARLPFATARDNFYAAARSGLEARVTWLDGRTGPARTLLTETLLPQARQGLRALDCGPGETDRYLGILRDRVRTGQTGAFWQVAHAEAHGRHFGDLVAAYRERQESGRPVHDWPP